LNLNWNQTHKNPTNQILVRITSQNKCKIDFINGQFEKCPQTGKIHIQACIIAEKALSDEHWRIFVRRIFGNACHVQTRRQGNSAAARDYCSKNSGESGDRVAGTEPFEHGTFRDTEPVSGGQGHRSDVTELRKWMKENKDKSFQQAQDVFMGTTILHFLTTQKQWFLHEMQEYNEEDIKAEQRAHFEGLPLYSWQRTMLTTLCLSPTRDRVIHIVVDPCGNNGKSHLSSVLSISHGFKSLTLGKR